MKGVNYTMSLENEVKELTAAVINLTAMIQGVVPNVSHPVQVPVPMGENFAPPFQPPSTVEPPPAADTTAAVPPPPAPTTAAAPPPPPPAAEMPTKTDAKGAKIITKKRAKELSDKMVDIAKNLGTAEPVRAILGQYGVASTADLTNAQADELVQKLEVL